MKNVVLVHTCLLPHLLLFFKIAKKKQTNDLIHSRIKIFKGVLKLVKLDLLFVPNLGNEEDYKLWFHGFAYPICLT